MIRVAVKFLQPYKKAVFMNRNDFIVNALDAITHKMYLAVTKTSFTTINFCNFKFRRTAELFYFVMCLPAGAALIIQNINNICKSTVN